MQNVGIYHVAAQLCSHTKLSSSVPRGSAPGPRWGLCPQTPINSRYALGFLSADFTNNVDPLCQAICLLRVCLFNNNDDVISDDDVKTTSLA